MFNNITEFYNLFILNPFNGNGNGYKDGFGSRRGDGCGNGFVLAYGTLYGNGFGCGCWYISNSGSLPKSTQFKLFTEE
jgi:hypothetical protein